MTTLRVLFFVLVAAFATGCFHWVPVSSLEEAANATRVRVELPNAPPTVLQRPTLADLRAVVVPLARIEVRKLNGWATALIITGSVLVHFAIVSIIFFVAVSATSSG